MVVDLHAKLVELETAILAAKPRFAFAPPASQAALTTLRTLCESPDVITWFAWHAGSQDGFLPDTSVCMIDVAKAPKEILRLREYPTDPPLPDRAFCPLLEDGGGGIWLYVATDGGGEIWGYDRGDIHWRKPCSQWLAEVHATWRAEYGVLRVEFVRIGRAMSGWRQAEVPLYAKKKVIAWLRNPKDVLTLRWFDSDVRLLIGDAVAWNELAFGVELTLTKDAAAALAKMLTTSDYARVADLEVKLSFSHM